MAEQIISPAFLFHFSVPCRYRRRLWSENGLQLPSACAIPRLSELEEKKTFADLRVAWNGQGVAFQVKVSGKSQPAWCRATRVEDSDGVQVWIDTRDTQTIHRASRYCHRFAFLPGGGGTDRKEPVARLLPINRAKEEPKAVAPKLLRVHSELHKDGYSLAAFVPAAALTGYDPDEYARLGFTYAVIDRELGWQTFSVGTEYPFTEDPSLWGTLELMR